MALSAALPAAAQVPQVPQATAAQLQARREIGAVESALENAVRYGAEMLTRHVQTSNVTDMVMLTGIARARGFRLEGYGVLFDVEFPSIRRTVMWSMRALQRPDKELLNAMRELRKTMQGPGDAAARQELDRDIRELETQIKQNDEQVNARKRPAASETVGALAAASGGSGGPGPSMTPGAVGDSKTDPKAIYQNEITNALVDAILDRGGFIGVGPEEWLTVAARESADRGFDPNDTSMTFILRIKGSDLNALQAQRLTKEDARKRVEIKQY
jgi:hypothetical protein